MKYQYNNNNNPPIDVTLEGIDTSFKPDIENILVPNNEIPSARLT